MNKRLIGALLFLLALLAAGTLFAQEPDTGAQASPSAIYQMGRAGQVGGLIEAVAVSGTYAYVGIGGQLAVFDVSAAASPNLVGQAHTGAMTEGIAAEGSHAYLVYGYSTMDVFDVSDPTDPKKVGSCHLSGGAHAHEVAVSGNYAYVAYGSGGLRVIDVSDPAAPKQVGALDMEAIAVAINGDHAYVAYWPDGLRVVDVSHPAAPEEVGVEDTPGQAQDVAFVAPDHVLVADGTRGLRFIDVADPTAPDEDGFFNPGTGLQTRSVFVQGDYAYFSNSSGDMQLWVMDVSSLPAYSDVDSAKQVPGEIVDISGRAGFAYVACSGGGLRTFSSATQEFSAYEAPALTNGIHVAGDVAYLADGENGLYTVDVSDPTAPVQEGWIDTPGDAIDVDVAGHYAYVADSSGGLRVINISNPTNPVEVGHLDTPGYAEDVDVSGSYAYVADSYAGLRIVNIANPSAPQEVGHLDTPDNADKIFVKGSTAYVANGGAGLRIIDVSTPSAPSEIGSFDEMGSIEDVAVKGDHAYLADDAYGLRIVDVSDPANPQQVGVLSNLQGTAVFAAGDYAHLGSYAQGLHMIDVARPATPVKIAEGWVNTARDVHVEGSYAYVAAHKEGLVIMNLPPFDLRIDAAGPVQSIEGMDLVKDKSTAIKAVIHKTGPGPAMNVAVQAEVDGTTYKRFWVAEYGNVYPSTYALRHPNSTYTLDFPSGDHTKTVYFFGDDLAPTGSTMQVSVEVDPEDAITETNEGNNIRASAAIPVHDTQWPKNSLHPDLFVYYFPLDWAQVIHRQPFADFGAFYEASSAFMGGVYPVSEERFESMKASIYSASTTVYRGQDGVMTDWELAAFTLRLWPELALAHPTADAWVAVVPRDWFSIYTSGNKTRNTRGIAFPNIALVYAEALLPDEPNGPVPALHEVGHKFGLREETEEYDALGTDLVGTGNYAEPGLWVKERIPILIDPNAPPNSIERDIWCFMGAYQASAEYWIDAEDYTGLLTKTQVTTALQETSHSERSAGLSHSVQNGSAEKAILASGIVGDDGAVALENWYVVPDAQLSDLQPGPYSFEYQDEGDTVLHQVSFDPSFQMGYLTLDDAPFAYIIPYVPGTARILIKKNGASVGQKDVSSSVPTVTVESPNGGEELAGLATIRWSGSDADGDALTYSLLMSRDNGATWEPLAGNLTEPQYTWGLSGVPPGDQYLARVVATDGFNTGEDVSDAPFTILNTVYLPLVLRNSMP